MAAHPSSPRSTGVDASRSRSPRERSPRSSKAPTVDLTAAQEQKPTVSTSPRLASSASAFAPHQRVPSRSAAAKADLNGSAAVGLAFSGLDVSNTASNIARTHAPGQSSNGRFLSPGPSTAPSTSERRSHDHSFVSVADVRSPQHMSGRTLSLKAGAQPSTLRPPTRDEPGSPVEAWILPRRLLARLVRFMPTPIAQTLPQFSPSLSPGHPPVSPSLLRPRPIPPAIARRRIKTRRALLAFTMLLACLILLYHLHHRNSTTFSDVNTARLNRGRKQVARGQRDATSRVAGIATTAAEALDQLGNESLFADAITATERPVAARAHNAPQRAAAAAEGLATGDEAVAHHKIAGKALGVAARRLAKAEQDEARRRKKANKYKKLLPLDKPMRRHIYGANFQPAPKTSSDDEDDDEDEDDGDGTAFRVDEVPTDEILARRFEGDKLRYEAEAEDWRQFEWIAPLPHSSLDQALESLNEDELTVREWIRRLHLQTPAQGLGLAADSDSRLLPDESPSPLSEPPEENIGGSSTKWNELLVELDDPVTGGKCEGATWLDSYKNMHEEILSGRRSPKMISYHCERNMNCGGLGDRLLGMTSAFFMGLVTDRAFVAEWQSPIPLDVVFDSPALNWSHSSFTSKDHSVLGQTALTSAARDLDIVHFDRLAMDITFGRKTWNIPPGNELTPGFERRDLAFRSPWIKLFTNRGMIVRSFGYPHLRKRLASLGLQRSTAFACISRYLFRPKPAAMQLIAQYTSVLAMPTVFSVGIQIRTGDISMKDPEYDLQNTVERHRPFFECARQLADTYADPAQKTIYYLVTDSANLKRDAARILGSQLIVTDMVPQHVHQKSGHADGVLGAVVEDWILQKTDMRVITQDSGFGKLASFASGKEATTVTLFPRFNPDLANLLNKNSHLDVDCTKPSAFSTFEQLASEWSLG